MLVRSEVFWCITQRREEHRSKFCFSVTIHNTSVSVDSNFSLLVTVQK
jgi:hypothetical protein